MREGPAKSDKVGAKVPKSVQRIFREARIPRGTLGALARPNRANEAGMHPSLGTLVESH